MSTCSLWIIKLSVSLYLIRLTNQFWAAKSLTSKTTNGRVIKTFLSRHLNPLFYTFLSLSYLAILLSLFIECRPFVSYWQVSPTPSASCRLGYGNLLTMGVLNIATDLMLVALPMPMILNAKLPGKVKAETLFLMLFPLVNIAFTGYRLPSIINHAGSQRYRTLLASIDVLISTATANALVVTSFLQDRGFKKLKYQYPEGEDGPIHAGGGHELSSIDHGKANRFSRLAVSSTGNGSKSPGRRRQPWGSDEDLMRDDSDGGQPTLHTTSSAGGGEAVEGAEGCKNKLSIGNHLSPHQKAETSIVAASRSESFEEEEVVEAGVERPRPTRVTSLHQGIVVETTWTVDVTER